MSVEFAPESLPEKEPEAARLPGTLIIKVLYFLFFATFGVFVSFINVYYRSIGLSGVQIGWLNAVIPLVGMLTGPFWGNLLDRTRWIKRLIGITTIGSTVAMLIIPSTSNFFLLLLLSAVYSFFNSTMPVFFDTLNFQLLGEHAERYGRQRVWGSVGFVIVTWTVGVLFDRIGLTWLFPIYAFFNVLLLGVTLFLPGRSVTPRAAVEKGSFRSIIVQPVWILFALGLILLNIGHRGMNGFLSVYIIDLGGNNDLVGSSASIGAISELPFMFFSAILIRKIGIRWMLLGSCLVFALRFVLYALMPDLSWVIPISLMHGLTFGMFWVSAVIAAKNMAPKNMIATSQSLVMAILSLSSIISGAVSGGIYDHLGGSWLFGVYAVLSLLSFFLLSRIGSLAGAATSQPNVTG